MVDLNYQPVEQATRRNSLHRGKKPQRLFLLWKRLLEHETCAQSFTYVSHKKLVPILTPCYFDWHLHVQVTNARRQGAYFAIPNRRKVILNPHLLHIGIRKVHSRLCSHQLFLVHTPSLQDSDFARTDQNLTTHTAGVHISHRKMRSLCNQRSQCTQRSNHRPKLHWWKRS